MGSKKPTQTPTRTHPNKPTRKTKKRRTKQTRDNWDKRTSQPEKQEQRTNTQQGPNQPRNKSDDAPAITHRHNLCKPIWFELCVWLYLYFGTHRLLILFSEFDGLCVSICAYVNCSFDARHLVAKCSQISILRDVRTRRRD